MSLDLYWLMDLAVLYGSAGLKQDVAYNVRMCPSQKLAVGELGSVVGTHSQCIAPKDRHPVQNAGHVPSREALVHSDFQAILTEVSSARLRHLIHRPLAWLSATKSMIHPR